MDDRTTQKPIVLFSSRYLPNMGGVEFFTANLARSLATAGREVLVVTTERTNDESADARRALGAGSVEVLRVGSWGPARIPFVRPGRQTSSCLAKLRSLGSFDALINTRFYDLSRVAARTCKRARVRPVLVDHGTGYIAFPSKLLSLAFKLAEHLVTANLKRYPIDFYGVSKDASAWIKTFGITSCGEIHNALDAEAFVGEASARDFRTEFGLADDVLCVTYAARLLADKGADAVIDAARALRDDPRLHFFVAGSGPMEQQVADAAAELGNLTYVGRLSHPDLAALLVQGDIFCLPTRYSEGLPTSLLEAGACGNALVSSRAGGVGEIIPSEEHGIILASPTAKALAEALRGLADDPARTKRLGETARQHICARFTWDATCHEVLEAFARASR